MKTRWMFVLLLLTVGLAPAGADAAPRRLFGLGIGVSLGFAGAYIPDPQTGDVHLSDPVLAGPIADVNLVVPLQPRLALRLWSPLSQTLYAEIHGIVPRPFTAWVAASLQWFLLAPERGPFLAPGLGLRWRTNYWYNDLYEPELAVAAGYEWSLARGHTGVTLDLRPSITLEVEDGLPHRVGIGGGVLFEASMTFFVLGGG